MPLPKSGAAEEDWASLGVRPPSYVASWSRLSSDSLPQVIALLVALAVLLFGREGPTPIEALALLTMGLVSIMAIRRGTVYLRRKRSTPPAAEVVRLVPDVAEWCLLRPYVIARTEDGLYVMVPEGLGSLGTSRSRALTSVLTALSWSYQTAYTIVVVRPLSLTEVARRPGFRVRWDRRLVWKRKDVPAVAPLELLSLMRGRFEIPSPSRMGHVVVGEGDVVEGLLMAGGSRSLGVVAAKALSVCLRTARGESPPVNLAKIKIKREHGRPFSSQKAASLRS